MIKIEIEIDDSDTNETINVVLPCNVRQMVDTTHDLQIVDWNADIPIDCDDVEKLSSVIDEINSENPVIDLEMFEKIFKSSGDYSICSDEFVRKMCNSDFMLEQISIDSKINLKSDKEKCSYYLINVMMIPFAKNITIDSLRDIQSHSPRDVNWNKIWKYYSDMGFKIIKVKDEIYVFHWGNAEI